MITSSFNIHVGMYTKYTCTINIEKYNINYIRIFTCTRTCELLKMALNTINLKPASETSGST